MVRVGYHVVEIHAEFADVPPARWSLWTPNITVPPDLVAALDDDHRVKAASESLGRSERYAVILPLLKTKTRTSGPSG